jgi:uncharacterized oxidoreductase
MLIGAENLARYVRDVFEGEGCAGPEAERIGRYLVAANLAGHDSHGVIRVPRYIGWLRDGAVHAGREPEVVTDGGAFALLDARFGFGQTAGPAAVAQGIARARLHGVAVVALRHSGHLGRIGEWAEQAAEAGFVSVHFVNVGGSLLVAPFGAVDRRFSTAPFAAGVPVAGRPPVVLDFATSLVAEGKVLVASKGGKPLPAGSLVEPDGTLSRDPDTLYSGRGAIRAFGDHKGSGLALICELLAGALTGSGCAGPPPRPFCNGMLSIYVAPDAGGSAEGFAAEVRSYLDFCGSARPAEPGGTVLVPGDPERACRTRRLAEGVPLGADVWDGLRAAGLPHGLDADRYREGDPV